MTDDPMDGAAIGETRTVRAEDRWGPWYGAGVDPYLGSDRSVGPLELADARIEGEPGNEEVVVEYEADVTKHLPRGWDRPIDERPTPRAEQEPTWRDYVVTVLATVIPVVFVGGVTLLLYRAMPQGELTINGEPVAFPPDPSMVGGAVITVMLIAIIVQFVAVRYLPAPSRRRYA